MRVETASNHHDRLRACLESVYSNARAFGLDHATILDQLTERVWNDPALAKCPAWVRMKLTTISQERLRGLYTATVHGSWIAEFKACPAKLDSLAFLRWQHRIGDAFVTSAEISARREAGEESVWTQVESTFVWNHKPDRAFGPWAPAMGAN